MNHLLGLIFSEKIQKKIKIKKMSAAVVISAVKVRLLYVYFVFNCDSILTTINC